MKKVNLSELLVGSDFAQLLEILTENGFKPGRLVVMAIDEHDNMRIVFTEGMRKPELLGFLDIAHCSLLEDDL